MNCYRFEITELNHEGDKVEGKVDVVKSDGIGGKFEDVGIYSFHREPGVSGLKTEWTDPEDDGDYWDNLNNYLKIYTSALVGDKIYWSSWVNEKLIPIQEKIKEE